MSHPIFHYFHNIEYMINQNILIVIFFVNTNAVTALILLHFHSIFGFNRHFVGSIYGCTGGAWRYQKQNSRLIDREFCFMIVGIYCSCTVNSCGLYFILAMVYDFRFNIYYTKT